MSLYTITKTVSQKTKTIFQYCVYQIPSFPPYATFLINLEFPATFLMQVVPPTHFSPTLYLEKIITIDATNTTSDNTVS